jgi:peptidoglycan/LPS O-acetylase OafA/YrhL
MSHDPGLDSAIVERTERTIGRGGYILVVAGLLFGMLLLILGQRGLSATVLAATTVALLGLPIVTVVAILAEELKRRDWGFALLALTVLALLAYNIIARLSQ